MRKELLLKGLIKLLLMLTLIILCLFNYRVFDIMRSKVKTDSTITGVPVIESITYYQNPFNADENVVFVRTVDNLFLYRLNDVTVAKLVANMPEGAISESRPVHWWIYAATIIIILIFPSYNFSRVRAKKEIIELKNDVEELKKIAALKKELKEIRATIKETNP